MAFFNGILLRTITEVYFLKCFSSSHFLCAFRFGIELGERIPKHFSPKRELYLFILRLECDIFTNFKSVDFHENDASAKNWNERPETRAKNWYSHNGVVVMKINKVIHLINIIKLSVCTWWNFTLNLLKHFIFSTFLNELLFTISDNIFQFPGWWLKWRFMDVIVTNVECTYLVDYTNLLKSDAKLALSLSLDEHWAFYIKYFLICFN